MTKSDSNATPLAVAVMVTTPKRISMACEAIEDFKQQSYPHKLLLVISEHSELSEIYGHRCDESIHFEVCRDQIVTLGGLRNFAIETANLKGAKYIIQWDDDDRYGAERMRLQVEALQSNPAAIASYLQNQVVELPDQNYVRERPARGIDGTICHLAKVAARYPHKDKGEDSVFLRTLDKLGRTITLNNDPTLYIRRYHGNNTWDLSHFKKIIRGSRIFNQCGGQTQPQIISRSRTAAPPPSRGVVWCASPKYLPMAKLSKESFKKYNPSLGYHIEIAEEGYASRRTKISVDQWTPFEHTLFVDADTVCSGDITEVFKLFETRNLAMRLSHRLYTMGHVRKSGWLHSVRQLRLNELHEVPDSTPHFNSGVMLLDQSKSTKIFYAHWREVWERWGGRTPDQFAMLRILYEADHIVSSLPHKWHHILTQADEAAGSARIHHFLFAKPKSRLTLMKNWSLSQQGKHQGR